MSTVACFWIESGKTARLGLRRFTFSRANADAVNCAGGYHNAQVILEPEVRLKRTRDGYIAALEPGKGAAPGKRDRRWPKTCATCPYRFKPRDEWQVNQLERWIRPDTGATVGYGLRDIPAGAMWHAFWWPEGSRFEGISLTVQLPDGLPWCVDGPTSDCKDHDNRTGHRCWTRTGDPGVVPPTVTATPSILTPGYHGFLTNGQLVSV